MRNDLPAALRPNSTLSVELPCGQTIEIAKCCPIFAKWNGTPPTFSFGGKPFVAMNGKPLFAELAILRLLEADGWKGVWVKRFGVRDVYTRTMPKDWRFTGCEVPQEDDRFDILEEIAVRAGRPGGCFDVYAWNGSKILFCEAKRAKKDQLRPSQKQWIQAVMSFEMLRDRLLIAEWQLA